MRGTSERMTTSESTTELSDGNLWVPDRGAEIYRDT